MRMPLDPWHKPYSYRVDRTSNGAVVRLTAFPDEKTQEATGIVEITNDPGDLGYKYRCGLLDKIGLKRRPCVH